MTGLFMCNVEPKSEKKETLSEVNALINNREEGGPLFRKGQSRNHQPNPKRH